MKGNKTVFVTGASRGIGKAIAAAFAIDGYNVAIMCKSSRNELLETERELKVYTPSILSLVGDLADYNTAKKAFRDIERTFGECNVLVNNAGISSIGLFNTSKPTDWDRVINSNFRSVLNCTHLALQSMVKNQSGSIINISSMWGEKGASCEALYSATKGAINSFTKSLAKELGPSKIRVNAISCGVIDTTMNSFLSPTEKALLKEEIPLCRFGRPDEVANVALFLASNDSSYITGQILGVDGGM